MTRTQMALRLVLVAGSASGTALAIDGPTAAVVGNPDPYPFVGRVQTIFTALNNHIGTGAYLGEGRVLTCAHVIDPHATGPIVDSMDVQFETFQLGGARYSALGVQHPQYQRRFASGEVLSENDVGIMLVLNRPPSPGANPVLATLGQAVGATLKVIGFTDNTAPAPHSRKKEGNFRIHSRTAMLYHYRSNGAAANGDYTQPGDSGGPHMVNIAPNGQPARWEIVGITRSGGQAADGANWSTAVRVDAQRPFIDGDGVAGKRVFAEFIDGADMNWETANRWGRSSAGVAQVPRDNDVVRLDPTRFADRDITVRITSNTANLDGLLNDVTLDVRKGTLKVTGTVGEKNGRRTGTGALNGGVITVGGTNDRASMDIGWSMHNAGTITIRQNGDARFGAFLPSRRTDAVLFNSAGARFQIDGGRALIDLGMLNAGAVSVAKGTLEVGKFLPDFTGQGADWRDPLAVRNWGQFTVDPAGVLSVTNGAGRRTAVFQNNAGATLTVRGDATGTARADVDRMDNLGTVRVRGGGSLITDGRLNNRGQVTISGTPAQGGYVEGWILNEGAGNIRVEAGGMLKGRVPTTRYGTTYTGIELRGTSSLDVRGGGVAEATGRFEIAGQAVARVASSVADGPGILRHTTTAGEALLQWGKLEFDTPVGAPNARLELTNSYWTLSPSLASITGRGTIEIKGDSTLNIVARAAGNNWNDIHIVYNGAKTPANGFVRLEVASHDLGGDTFAGLATPFALESLCLTNNSRVTLTDLWGSEDALPGAEVLYVERLGLMAGSVLDLAGKKLYYKDFGCGGAFAGTFLNGTPIRLTPAPGAVVLLALGLLSASRRRRG